MEKVVNELVKVVENNVARLNALPSDLNTEGKIFKPFKNIVQQNILVNNFANTIWTVTIPSVPTDAEFILADVFLSNGANDMWSVTFSRDENSSCRVWSSNGGLPATNFNGRTQTTTLFYDAPEDGTNSYPRYGQFS